MLDLLPSNSIPVTVYWGGGGGGIKIPAMSCVKMKNFSNFNLDKPISGSLI